MPPYRLRIERSFEKDLRRLPEDLVARVYEWLERLPEEPFPPGVVKLKGAERSHRIRIGNYRIVYEVDQQEQVITIFYVRHRKDVYRK